MADRRATTLAIKMLHQMFVWVVVVASGLVLIRLSVLNPHNLWRRRRTSAGWMGPYANEVTEIEPDSAF